MVAGVGFGGADEVFEVLRHVAREGDCGQAGCHGEEGGEVAHFGCAWKSGWSNSINRKVNNPCSVGSMKGVKTVMQGMGCTNDRNRSIYKSIKHLKSKVKDSQHGYVSSMAFASPKVAKALASS